MQTVANENEIDDVPNEKQHNFQSQLKKSQSEDMLAISEAIDISKIAKENESQDSKVELKENTGKDTQNALQENPRNSPTEANKIASKDSSNTIQNKDSIVLENEIVEKSSQLDSSKASCNGSSSPRQSETTETPASSKENKVTSKTEVSKMVNDNEKHSPLTPPREGNDIKMEVDEQLESDMPVDLSDGKSKSSKSANESPDEMLKENNESEDDQISHIKKVNK